MVAAAVAVGAVAAASGAVIAIAPVLGVAIVSEVDAKQAVGAVAAGL